MSKEKEQAKESILSTENLNVQDLSLNQIDSIINGLSLHKDNVLKSSLESTDVSEIIKAQNYLESTKKPQKSPDLKSHLFVPDEAAYHTGRGYKENYSGVPFEVLQKMGNIPIVYSIINTRLDQVKNFLKFSNDEEKAGYTIVRKKGLFEDKEKELTSEDKKKIEYIVNYLEYGGRGGKWDDGEDLVEFVTKIVKDSLTVDQATAEIIRDRKGDLFKHVAVDGSTIRILDSNDQRFKDQFKGMERNGYLPKYAQVWNQNIVTNHITGRPVVYYPWELMYGVRNKSSNVRLNGYGVSELEAGIELVTWILWGMQYNGNFFKQGSQPKGFIKMKEGNMSNNVLNEFRQAWRQMMTGVHNCLSGDTFIITREGRKELQDFFVENSEDKYTEIWTGKKFEKGLVYKSGEKVLNKITLNNGMTIKSSPDHRFKTVNDEGDIVWKLRSDLKEGDFLMVNKSSISLWEKIKGLFKKTNSSNELKYFHFEKIVKLEEFEEKEEMYDVQIFDNENQFIANGILSHNSHKIPVFEGLDMEWVDLQKNNRDMEFQNWNEFLIVMFCSMYKIDPSELGFHFKNQKDMFGQDGQRERLDHSQKKGLTPLLRFLQKLINKFIVSEIDEQYEFQFTGVEVEDEERQVDLDKKKSEAGFVSHEDMFEKYTGREFDSEKDTILNQVYQSAQQAKQFGGQEMNDLVDEETREGDDGVQNPFDEYEKSAKSDPIAAESMKYIDNLFKGKLDG